MEPEFVKVQVHWRAPPFREEPGIVWRRSDHSAPLVDGYCRWSAVSDSSCPLSLCAPPCPQLFLSSAVSRLMRHSGNLNCDRLIEEIPTVLNLSFMYSLDPSHSPTPFDIGKHN
jgi:hypothetical protein